MTRDDAWVAEQLAADNAWYTASQFAWANRPSIRPIYDRRFHYFRRCIEAVRVRVGRAVTVLDAGCGDGYWLLRLGELPGVELAGLEQNPLRADRARETATRAKVSCGSLLDLTADRRYDVVLLSQVLEHIEDDLGLLKRLREIVAPGGILLLGTPNEGSRLHRYWRRREGDRFQTDHLHFYTEKELRRKIDAAGFAVASVMREAFFPGHLPTFYRLTRRRWGFALLALLTLLWPGECSDYYFECRRKGEADG